MAQGISGDVQDKGLIKKFLLYLYTGLKHSLQDIGIWNVQELQEGGGLGLVRFKSQSALVQLEGAWFKFISSKLHMYMKGILFRYSKCLFA